MLSMLYCLKAETMCMCFSIVLAEKIHARTQIDQPKTNQNKNTPEIVIQ